MLQLESKKKIDLFFGIIDSKIDINHSEIDICYLRLKMDPPERFFGPTRKLPVSGFSQSIFRFRTPQAKN